MTDQVSETVSSSDPLMQAKPALSATSDAPKVETVEAEAPAEEVVQAAEEVTETEIGEETEKGKDETPAWMKAKITKEANKRRAAETDKTAAEARANAAEANLKKALDAVERLTGDSARTAKKDADAADPRPQRDTFDSPDTYDTALVEWAGRRAAQAATAQVEAQAQRDRDAEKQEATKTATEERNRKTLEGFKERKDKFVEDHPDYDDLVDSPDLNISIPMADAIMNDEDGPAIAYYLAQNPDESTRISKLDPVLAIAQLGRIAAKLNAKPVTQSKPAPIKPLNTGASPAVRKSAHEESMEEYGARRAQELRGKANGAVSPH